MTQSKHESPSASSARAAPEVREDFRAFDRDHDGRINFLEFRELMESLDPDMTDEEALIGFREIDSNRDGGIDLHEFLTWWTAD
jgi:Ca2+-binding EF-hand superfamily protein